MKVNTQKRIFKGVTLSLVLCAVILGILSPVALAATSYTEYVCEVLGNVNVRSGPGTGYGVVTQYTKGTTFLATQEDYFEADGYKWYSCPDGWVAQTGRLKFHTSVISREYISCISPSGALSWGHICNGDGSDNWGYYVEVLHDGYWFSCDCGWKTRVTFPRKQIFDPDDGSLLSEIYFQGLDTDNDERVDLYPGQSKKLPNRVNSDLRPYTLLEFYDESVVDVPTVTIVFVDAERNEIERYTFNFSVDIRVLDYGVEMVGNDGTYVLHELKGKYIVTDLASDIMIADSWRRYQVDYSIKDFWGNPYDAHPQYGVMIAPPGDGPNGPLENIVSDLKGFFGTLNDFFGEFGGLNGIFTDEDSPVHKFLDGIGAGVASVFNCVSQFIVQLPSEITAPIFVVFILAVVIGIVRLFL